MSEEDASWAVFATGKLGCPVCGEHIPVPVLARIEEGVDEMRLETQADMAETWAHMWAHEAKP